MNMDFSLSGVFLTMNVKTQGHNGCEDVRMAHILLKWTDSLMRVASSCMKQVL